MDIKSIFMEWVKTFSNKASFLSAKRIERFAIFSLMLAVTLFFLIKGIIQCQLSAVDFTIVVGLWMGYAGFNTIQGRKDNNGETDK